MINITILVFLVFSQTFSIATDSKPLLIPGHVNIGVLANLREGSSKETCSGKLKPWALQEIVALEWTLSVIGNQSKSGGIKYGLKIFDNCGSEDRLIRQAVKLSEDAELDKSPVIGIIQLGDSHMSKAAVSILHAFSVPLLTTQPTPQKVLQAEHIFTTAPHLRNQIQAVVEVVNYKTSIYGKHHVGVISSCENALNVLKSVFEQKNVKMDASLIVDPNNRTALINDTTSFLISEVGFQGIVILLLETDSLYYFSENLKNSNLTKRAEWFWVLAVLNGASTEGQLNSIVSTLKRSVVIEPYSIPMPGLSRYLSDVQYIRNFSIVAPLLDQITIDPMFCQHADNCTFVQTEDVLSGIRATSVVKAASSLVSAFRLIQLEKCPHNSICPAIFAGKLANEMVNSLKKVSYFSRESSDSNRYTADGRFITKIILLKRVRNRLKQIATYKEDKGIVWLNPIPGIDNLKAEIDSMDEPNTEDIVPLMNIIFAEQEKYGGVSVFLIFLWSILGMFGSAHYGLTIIYLKMNGILEESQMPDTIMLLALLSCFASGILSVALPSEVVCILRNTLPYASLIMFFSLMILKTYDDRKKLHEYNEKKTYLALTRFLTPFHALALFSVIGTATVYLALRHMDEERLKIIKLDSKGVKHCACRLGFVLFQLIYITILLMINLSLQYLMASVKGFTKKRIFEMSRTLLLLIFIFGWVKMICFSGGQFRGMIEALGFLVIATILLFSYFWPKAHVKLQELKRIRQKNKMADGPLPTISSVRKSLNSSPDFCEPPYIRPWRMDPDSPILHYSIPPPPPPPLKKDYNMYSHMGHLEMCMDEQLIYSK